MKQNDAMCYLNFTSCAIMYLDHCNGVLSILLCNHTLILKWKCFNTAISYPIADDKFYPHIINLTSPYHPSLSSHSVSPYYGITMIYSSNNTWCHELKGCKKKQRRMWWRLGSCFELVLTGHIVFRLPDSQHCKLVFCGVYVLIASQLEYQDTEISNWLTE